jgi:2-polyprenyl-6-methoxyphenol hydroxylase-like FAD-dependent oxidoreductase
MSRTKRIAIVGAGVAGMALAILATQQGYQVSLFERGSKVSSIGAGVTLWPNAMFVLQQLGLDQQIMRLGGTPDSMRQFDRHGVLQTEFDIMAVNALCGLPSVTILRSELMRLLAGALDSLAVDIKFDCAITAADVTALGQTFDLVVGADGRMNSIVRQALYPQPVMPRYHGFVNVIGVSRPFTGGFDQAIHEYRDLAERFGIVPVSDSCCYWAGAWNTEIDRARPAAAWYHELQQRFRHWPDPVQKVLQCCDSSSVRHIFVHDIDPLPYWHQGNVLMIGDAAHASLPTSGQGACQALEDAWHLGRLLREHEALDVALHGFYQQRQTKTTAAQLVGRQIARQIFAEQPKPLLPATAMSAAELSQFWMQGLQSQI